MNRWFRLPVGSWRQCLGRPRGSARHIRQSWRRLRPGAAGLLAVALLTATTAGVSGVAGAQAATGSTMTVLEGEAFLGNDPTGLDPATSTTVLANATLLDAIYGELFEVGPNGTVQPDLAAGYKLTDGAKTLTIHLRPGVKFSDGSPFNAAAVVFNFKRDLSTTTSGSNPPWPAKPTITDPNATTVVVHFSTADGAAVNEMLDTNLIWIVSPTSLESLGEKTFRLKPVGAGPFEVVSDTLSTKLVLKKNPNYWQKGHPFLNGLTFQTVASDQAALEALQSKAAQAYEYMTTPRLVSSYKAAGFKVTTDPGVSTLDVQIETIAPFNNLKAREALYYATNNKAIDQKIFDNTCPISESFTGPGGLFYEPKVPGYRNYDLAKAKAIVKSIGGLSFTMYYSANGNTPEETDALQQMYKAAGMNVKISPIPDLASLVAEYNTHKWTVIPASIGSFDPAGGIGVSFRLASNGPFTGIHDKTVDKYIDAASASVSPKVRASNYRKLASYLSQQAYTPFVCTPESWDIALPGASGPGLTTATDGFGEGPLVKWEDVSMSK